jgi:hypothetical protein
VTFVILEITTIKTWQHVLPVKTKSQTANSATWLDKLAPSVMMVTSSSMIPTLSFSAPSVISSLETALSARIRIVARFALPVFNLLQMAAVSLVID